MTTGLSVASEETQQGEVKSGGGLVAEVLAVNGVRSLFTVCGGHISPILVAAEKAGIDVVGCRDERSAVFAADATARMTGGVGCAAVTAGPGVTNALTALKNAQLAQSPVVVLGGATASILKGRGSLQDIDQMSVVSSAVKWRTRVTKYPDVIAAMRRAFGLALDDPPGPTFVELAVDVLYPEPVVREMFAKEMRSASLAARLYLEWYMWRTFKGPSWPRLLGPRTDIQLSTHIAPALEVVRNAKRPVLLLGGQALGCGTDVLAVRRSLEAVGFPVWLSGAARGSLGVGHPLHYRHARAAALKEADVVVAVGSPFDFRLKYGRGMRKDVRVVTVNTVPRELWLNRTPEVPVLGRSDVFLAQWAKLIKSPRIPDAWEATLRSREDERDREIASAANAAAAPVDPIHFFIRLDAALTDDSVVVMDGGDFVATGSYILRPHGPRRWLDPGVFGTLGVGGGFAVGACAARPGSEVWLVTGDGASAYSLAEIDTCVRHGFAPIIVVGNDASWQQIAREQVPLLGADTGTRLLHTDYQTVAEGYGGKGFVVRAGDEVDGVLAEARAVARGGRPALVNVHLGPSTFRAGSISM